MKGTRSCENDSMPVAFDRIKYFQLY